MEEELRKGECLDVNVIGVPLEGFEGVVWELKRGTFKDNKNYCDAKGEQWIWSIGQRVLDARVFAAIDTRFYGNEMFACLWLK